MIEHVLADPVHKTKHAPRHQIRQQANNGYERGKQQNDDLTAALPVREAEAFEEFFRKVVSRLLESFRVDHLDVEKERLAVAETLLDELVSMVSPHSRLLLVVLTREVFQQISPSNILTDTIPLIYLLIFEQIEDREHLRNEKLAHGPVTLTIPNSK